MKIFEEDTVYNVYELLIKQLLAQPLESNGTKEITNCILKVNNPSIKNIEFYHRAFSNKYGQAELEWYWSADNRCEIIGKYAKMWLALSDDGITNNSAYGYIIHKKHNKDQLQEVIKELEKDKNSRKAVIIINDPTIDKLTTKDLQCTIGLQFLIRDNQLEETVYMRSNDVFFGFPYDYIYFLSLGYYVAKHFGIKIKSYVHCATSMHMYERNIKSFEEDTKSVKVNIDFDKIIGECYEK